MAPSRQYTRYPDGWQTVGGGGYKRAGAGKSDRYSQCPECFPGNKKCWVWESKLSKYPNCPECSKPYTQYDYKQGKESGAKAAAAGATAVGEAVPSGTAVGKEDKEAALQLLCELLSKGESEKATELSAKIRAAQEPPKPTTPDVGIGTLQGKQAKLKKELEKQVLQVEQWKKHLVEKEAKIVDVYFELGDTEEQIKAKAELLMAKPEDDWTHTHFNGMPGDEKEKFQKVSMAILEEQRKLEVLKTKYLQTNKSPGSAPREAPVRAATVAPLPEKIQDKIKAANEGGSSEKDEKNKKVELEKKTVEQAAKVSAEHMRAIADKKRKDAKDKEAKDAESKAKQEVAEAAKVAKEAADAQSTKMVVD
jgi:hypothetical protein